MARLAVTETISLDEDELSETFVLASGPGGQNVNKVSSAVQLRFDVGRSTSLPDDVRARLRALAGRRVTNEGVLVIIARAYRSQERNRAAARERLVDLIRRAAVPPKPRKPTRPSRATKRRRLEGKRHRSDLKRSRGPVCED